MKITYLVNKEQEDGSVRLSEVSHAEWQTVVKQNRRLPSEERRYFIYDYIAEGNEMDCMIIEAPYEDFSAWHREHMRAQRNREFGKNFEILSLDFLVRTRDGFDSYGNTLPSEELLEEAVCTQVLIEELRERLAAWRPWGNDILDLYLAGKKHTSRGIAEKYGVSAQVVCKYKRQFETFVKNFLSGVSNEAPFCEEGR